MTRQDKINFLSRHKKTKGVYAILKDGNVFYIGISRAVGTRILSHLRFFGYDCDFMLLQRVYDKKGVNWTTPQQYEIERRWILKFKRFGVRLINKLHFEKPKPHLFQKKYTALDAEIILQPKK